MRSAAEKASPTRAALRRWRLQRVRGNAAADRRRREQPRRPRRAEPVRSRSGDQLRAVPPAPGRRCQLPEFVRAEKPADPRAHRCVPGQGPVSRFRRRARRPTPSAPIPGCCCSRDEADGAVPVIADANSMTYVLHKQLGEDIVSSDAVAATSGCGSSPRCATASSRASC